MTPHGNPALQQQPLVSVVVAVSGPPERMTECLRGVYSQSYGNVEIVLVGKPRAEGRDTRSRQRNRAILASEGEFVFPLDADIALRSDAIEKAVAMCSAGFDYVAINNRAPSPASTVLGKVREAEWEALDRARHHVAGNFFRRRDVVGVGLYDESLYAGEDYDLHNRMLAAGFRFGIVDSLAVHLGEPDSLREVVRKNIVYGRNIQIFISKHGVVQVQPFRVTYLRAAPRFRQYFVPFIIYKVVQYLSAGVGLAFWLAARTRIGHNLNFLKALGPATSAPIKSRLRTVLDSPEA
jgi:glycosyltransferase involved in cell wall biosynthesis